MPDTLVIRLKPTAAGEASWMIVDDAGHKLSDIGTGDLTHCAAVAGQRRVVVLVPGADVFLTEVDLPVRGRSRLRNAAAFALEEHVIDDVEKLHVAVGRRLPSGRYPVALVAQERMQEWAQRFNTAGLKPAQVIPDTAGIPGSANRRTVFIEDNLVYLKDGEQPAVMLDAGSIAETLDAAGFLEPGMADADNDLSSVTVYLDEASNDENSQLLDGIREAVPDLDVRILVDPPLAHFAHQVITNNRGLNLLQGRYAPETNLEKTWRPWQNAAVLAGALLVVSLGAKGLELLKLSALEDELDKSMATIYEGVTGQQARPGTALQQFRQLYNSQIGATGSADQGFLTSLAALAAVLADTEDVLAERLSYRNNIMDLEVTATGVQALDTIRRQISEQTGLVAEILSANPQGDRLRGRLQIRTEGSE